MPEFKNISPTELTRFVSFFRDEEGKKKLFEEYNEQSMQYKQAEGASYLFNLLNEKSLGLLADEVGMGKTIQALAVCSALWQQKPNARILVLAPRNEVAFNWMSEYETFINIHYKIKDDIVKSRIDGTAINPAIFCTNLYDLTKEVQKKWGRLFIGKISSFSGLYSQSGVNDRLEKIDIEPDKNYENPENIIEAVQGIGELLRVNISKHLPEGKFDLVIIDEAHYFRNKNGGSLRVNVAQQFFNKNENKIAKRALLLTATPNHTSSDNIKAIVSYFDDGKYNNVNYEKILNDICLRRFRRLSKKGKVKYNYRNEIPRKSDFKDNKMSELLFGIYQKQLVKEYVQGSLNGGRRNILGFLEGTEFIPNESINSEEEEKELREGSDFTSGADGNILLKLSTEYKRIFAEPPAHPKYNLLIEDLIQADSNLSRPNDKKLVFVRRIPSVREIASRSIHKYDEILLKKISKAHGVDINLSININEFRAYFERIMNSLLVDEELGDLEITDEENDIDQVMEKVPSSKIMYLFKTLKKGSGVTTSTHASRFRLRFTRSKPSIFNIFFAPGSDYFSKEYDVDIYKSKLKENLLVDDYFRSCLLHRTSNSVDHRGMGLKIQTNLAGRIEELEKSNDNIHLKTLFTIYWNYLGKTDTLSLEKKVVIRNKYLSFNAYQKEALSLFVEKGILLASTGLVDLYIAFIEASKSDSRPEERGVVDLYNRFTERVEKCLSESSIPELISTSILNFNILCEKVFNLSTTDKLLNEEWTNFRDAQPAYAYSGDTKNQRVMTSFNTPFFPDVLISTSVLQEGVNLQYFCDQIFHYGIAWTPGDNEQRVGRIDRMFSKTEKMLEESDSHTLDIVYPYLKNTIDQDHLANFIHKKYFAEDLIDKCQAYTGKASLDPANFNHENWQQFFRKPNDETSKDPYPVKDHELAASTFKFSLNLEALKINERIINTFKSHEIPIYNSNYSPDTICVLDPKLNNGRHQPVLVKLNYDPELTGLLDCVTYTLSLVSPLGTKKEIKKFEAKYDEFKKKYEKDYLNVKLCLDRDQSTSSMLGVYAKVELPVFLNHHDKPLSSHELLKNYDELIYCSDFIEMITFGDRDLLLDSVESKKNEEIKHSEKLGVLRRSTRSLMVDSHWKEKNQYVYLEAKYRNGNLRDLFVSNHSEKYIKYMPTKMIVPYHAADIQEIEIAALEEIYRIKQKDSN